MSFFTRAWRILRSPAALALATTLLVSQTGGLQSLDFRLQDLQASLIHHEVPSDLVIVEIDARSLQQLHKWPWPRHFHAQLLDRLHQAGVADIFYDVDFSSESSPENDQRLAQAISRYKPEQIMLPGFVQPDNNLGRNTLLASTPLPILRQHSVLASVNMHPDSDGLIRYVSGEWHLGTETAILPGIRMRPDHAAPNGFQLDYSIHPRSFSRISFKDVLDGNFDPALLKNKHIIVGATAIELGDMLPVPVYRSLPGAVVQALAYQTLVEGIPTPSSTTANLSGLLILAVLLGVLFKYAGWKQALLAVVVSSLAILCASIYVFWQWRLIMPTAQPFMLLGTGYGFFLVSRIEQQHLRLLVQAFDLRRQDALMSSVVNNSLDAIITMTDHGLIRSANPAALQLFGHRLENMAGNNMSALIVGIENSAQLSNSLPSTIVDTDKPIERQAVHSDGRIFPVEILLNRIVFEQDVVLTVFIRDITERHAQRAILEHQATHDALTELANRYRLNAQLDAIQDEAEGSQTGFALLLIDLDKFKEINDTLGHSVGDQILIQIAARFTSCMQRDMLLARLGGDEFAVLLPLTQTAEEATHLAESLHQSLTQPFSVEGLSLEVDASIGIALYPAHANTPSLLLQHADTAMYHAKRSNSGSALYMPELTEHNALRMTISTSLRQAMAESQLNMFYQPKLNLETNTVDSVEALLRWTHPQMGFIPPDKIIDVAESTGLIWPLTEWTLIRAIRDSQTWLAHGHQMHVAVNLSARLLQDASLIDRIRRCLESCAADPQWLTLEITESAIMSDPARAMKNAHALQAIGIQLSIDDFGTGYSSLSYLRNLPAQELKIDKSFVMEMLNQNNDYLIVQSTINLAHTLGLKVVAEGIETADIQEALRQLGCDIAQGYHISRPVPLNQLEDWLAKRADEQKHMNFASPSPASAANTHHH